MSNLLTKIFLDSGDPTETQRAKDLLGFIDGQTTNPSLIAKNPEIAGYLNSGKKLSEIEALDQYRQIVEKISQITDGPISVQVIADKDTSKEDMIRQAKIYHDWVPNAVVKFPITHNGLQAAADFCLWGPVNLTLNFSQSQAAAVYQATRKVRFPVFISPFVGRLDEISQNGMELIANILKMFNKSDHHVQVLTSSIREIEHLLYALYLKSPCVTVPLKILEEWKYLGFKVPEDNYHYDDKNLHSIAFEELTLDKDWQDYDIKHELTDRGLDQFMLDWKKLI